MSTTSLRAKIVERRDNLRTAASKEEPDSGKWFRLNKTADELEQVLAELDKVIGDIEASSKEAYSKSLSLNKPETINTAAIWAGVDIELMAVLERLRGKA